MRCKEGAEYEYNLWRIKDVIKRTFVKYFIYYSYKNKLYDFNNNMLTAIIYTPPSLRYALHHVETIAIDCGRHKRWYSLHKH